MIHVSMRVLVSVELRSVVMKKKKLFFFGKQIDFVCKCTTTERKNLQHNKNAHFFIWLRWHVCNVGLRTVASLSRLLFTFLQPLLCVCFWCVSIFISFPFFSSCPFRWLFSWSAIRVFLFHCLSVFIFQFYFRTGPHYVKVLHTNSKCNIISRPLNVKKSNEFLFVRLMFLIRWIRVWESAQADSHLVIVVCSCTMTQLLPCHQLNAIIAAVVTCGSNIAISHPESSNVLRHCWHTLHLPKTNNFFYDRYSMQTLIFYVKWLRLLSISIWCAGCSFLSCSSFFSQSLFLRLSFGQYLSSDTIDESTTHDRNIYANELLKQKCNTNHDFTSILLLLLFSSAAFVQVNVRYLWWWWWWC